MKDTQSTFELLQSLIKTAETAIDEAQGNSASTEDVDKIISNNELRLGEMSERIATLHGKVQGYQKTFRRLQQNKM